MSTREVRDYLADLLRYAETSVRLVGALTVEDLTSDERTALALETTGKAAGKLPRECRKNTPTCRGAR